MPTTNDDESIRENVTKALEIAFQCGQIDGDHHKTWVIDQMVRAFVGSNEAYEVWVAKAKAGDDGPETYEWDEGIAP
jgi:hypothetical protein